MPAGDDPRVAVVTAVSTEYTLAVQSKFQRPANIHTLLGFTYAPGDLVLDTVTGLTGTILHAAHHTLIRAAAAP